MPQTDIEQREMVSEVKKEDEVIEEKCCGPAGDFEYMDLSNPVNCLRLRGMMLSIVEELKIKRTTDIENEDRIKLLVQEKYELERKHDAEMKRFCGMEEQHRKDIQEVRRQHKEEIYSLQEESKQLQVYRECTEKEIKMLKDDVRNLQLAKYSLEKKIREQDSKLHLQNGSAEQHLKQISSVEQKFRSLSNQFSQITESEERLQRNVHEAVRLNKILMYMNEHQKCMVERYKSDSNKLQQKIIELNTKLLSKEHESKSIEYERNIANLKEQIQLVQDEKKAKEKELTEVYESKLLQQQKLQDSYKLIELHLDNAEKYKSSIVNQEKECDQLKEQLQTLKTECDDTSNRIEEQNELHNQDHKKWQKQDIVHKNEIKDLKDMLASTGKTKNELEELNTDWAEKNIELSEKVSKLQEILDVEKVDTCIQTGVPTVTMTDIDCQTELATCTQALQTDNVCSSEVHVQTKVTVYENSFCQTDQIIAVDQFSETDVMPEEKKFMKDQYTETKSDIVQFCNEINQKQESDDKKTSNEKGAESNTLDKGGFVEIECIKDKNCTTGESIRDCKESVIVENSPDADIKKSPLVTTVSLKKNEVKFTVTDLQNVSLSEKNTADLNRHNHTVQEQTQSSLIGVKQNTEIDSMIETMESPSQLHSQSTGDVRPTEQNNKNFVVEEAVKRMSQSLEGLRNSQKEAPSPVVDKNGIGQLNQKLSSPAITKHGLYQEEKNQKQLSPYSRYSALYKFQLNKLLGHETPASCLDKPPCELDNPSSVEQKRDKSKCIQYPLTSPQMNPLLEKTPSSSKSVVSDLRSSTSGESKCSTRQFTSRLSLQSSNSFFSKSSSSPLSASGLDSTIKTKNYKDPVVTVKSKSILKDPTHKKQKRERAVRFAEDSKKQSEDQSLFSDDEDDWMEEKNKTLGNKKDLNITESKAGKKRKLYNESEGYLSL